MMALSILRLAFVLFIGSVASLPAGAQTRNLSVEPVADTTIYGGTAISDGLSDGAGAYLWMSVTAEGLVRRALLRFDLQAIPRGALVREARLTLYQSRSREDHAVQVHRLLSPWGEAASNAGSAGNGAPAQAGDATWIRSRFPDIAWASPGGDFTPAASASIVVRGPGESYTWGSTATMVQDVQRWVDEPASNHGWILIGHEAGNQNAKRFESRNNSNAAIRPRLVVVYDEPGLAAVDTDIPVPGWALALLAAGLAWRAGRPARAPRVPRSSRSPRTRGGSAGT